MNEQIYSKRPKFQNHSFLKRKKSHDRRYSTGVIPVSRLKYLEKNEALGKCISSAIVAADLLVWRSSALMRITSAGSLGLIYLLAMLLALFFSSFGLIVSNYSDNMQQAIFVMWFFVVILLLLSGLFTPTRSMPSWAYATTYVNPMHYFIDAIRTVMVRGGNFASIAHQVLALAAIALGMGCWAVVSYKKNS